MVKELGLGGSAVLDVAINDGEIVNYQGSFEASVGIRDGRIVTLSEDALDASLVIDATDRLVLPGLIDPHTHFQPNTEGQAGSSIIEWSDDFYSGTASAASGGVTTVVDFAVQAAPSGTLGSIVDQYMTVAAQDSVVDYSFHVGVTVPSQGTLEEMRELASRGLRIFKFFRTYRDWGIYSGLGFIREALKIVADVNGVAAVHCEQDEIVTFLRNQYLERGLERRLDLYSDTRPSIAEEIAIDEVSALAREAGAEVYAVHISSALGLDAVRRAKSSSSKFRAECGLHYLFHDRSVYESERAPLFFMTPPFRESADIAALWSGLEDGSLDWIGTDHSPHMKAEKLADPTFGPGRDGSVFGIPPGFTGVEEMLPLLYTYGVQSGRISLCKLVQLLSYNSAKALRLPGKGCVGVGYDADIVVYDPSSRSRIDIDRLHSASDFTIYQDFPVHGHVEHTFCRGRHLVRDGQFVGGRGGGQFLAT